MSAHETLIAIGASAGGPGVLATVFKDLPKDFPAAIVVVQHLDEQFADGMALWLDEIAALRVRVAREGDRPRAGEVLVRDLQLYETISQGAGGDVR